MESVSLPFCNLFENSLGNIIVASSENMDPGVTPREYPSGASERTQAVDRKIPFVGIFREAAKLAVGFLGGVQADFSRGTLRVTLHRAYNGKKRISDGLNEVRNASREVLSLRRMEEFRTRLFPLTKSLYSRDELHGELRQLHKQLLTQREYLENAVNMINDAERCKEGEFLVDQFKVPFKLHEQQGRSRPNILVRIVKEMKKSDELELKDHDKFERPNFHTLSERVTREIARQVHVTLFLEISIKRESFAISYRAL
jgi:hypothetical protein